MLKDKNPLLKIDLKEEKLELFYFLKHIYEAFYNLFDLILEDPIDNFWYECFGMVLGYSQVLLYLVDKTVSK